LPQIHRVVATDSQINRIRVASDSQINVLRIATDSQIRGKKNDTDMQIGMKGIEILSPDRSISCQGLHGIHFSNQINKESFLFNPLRIEPSSQDLCWQIHASIWYRCNSGDVPMLFRHRFRLLTTNVRNIQVRKT
jgi:hypothetical protein